MKLYEMLFTVIVSYFSGVILGGLSVFAIMVSR